MADLVRLFDECGARAARDIRGDFVLAHISPTRSEVRIYRGLTSMIAIFWTFGGNQLEWSTDPLDLLPGEPGLSDIDVSALPMILAEHGMPPGRSPFAGIHRIPAGCRLAWGLMRDRAPKVDQFDAFAELGCRPRSAAEAASELRARVAEATSGMLSGAPAAVVMLSGGIDSSVVAAEAAHACSNVLNLHLTLSGFPGFDADEASARSVAEHTCTAFTAYDLGAHLGPGGDYLDKAFRHNAPSTHVPVNGFTVAAEAARELGSRFVVSGLMSDNLMMPDARHEETLGRTVGLLNPFSVGRPVWEVLARSGESMFSVGSTSRSRWRVGLRFLRGAALADPELSLPGIDVLGDYLGFSDKASETLREAIIESAARAALERSSTGWITFREAFDLPHLHAGYLNDLRPRELFFGSPFTNRDVVEYLMSMPVEYKIGVGHGVKVRKFILRYAYSRGQFPRPVAWRTSQAYLDAVPATFLRNNFQRCADLLSTDSVLAQLGILQHDFMKGWSPSTIHRGADRMTRLMGVEAWLREFL